MFNRVCDRFTGLMMVWVLAACAAGYLWPEALAWMKPQLEWLFALTMLGIGFVTPPGDFNEILKRPRIVGLGMIAQFGIMPLGATCFDTAFSKARSPRALTFSTYSCSTVVTRYARDALASGSRSGFNTS